jgi:hypothetical protein
MNTMNDARVATPKRVQHARNISSVFSARHANVTKPAFFWRKSRYDVTEQSKLFAECIVSKRSPALLESVANHMQDALSWKLLPER